MLISSLNLENIRSYTNQNITFQQGINVLYGNIGSGKSTILLAIEVALFGLKKGEGNFIIRKGTSKGSITLSLEDVDLKLKIEIMRTFKKTKSGVSQESGKVVLNGEEMELSTQEMNSYIFNYFNFPLSFINKDKTLMYRFTHYTPQEQLKEILTTQSDKRLEILRKVFNIDKYKQLQQASVITSKQFSKDLLVYQTRVEEIPTNLDESISSLKESIEKNIIHIEELKQKEIDWDVKFRTIISNKKILESRRAKIEQKIQRSKEITAQIEKSNEIIMKNQADVTLYTEQVKKLQDKKHQFILEEKELQEKLEHLKKKEVNIEEKYLKIQAIQEKISDEKAKLYRYDDFISKFIEIRDLKHDSIENTSRIKDIEVNNEKKQKIVKKLQKKEGELELIREKFQSIEQVLLEKKAQIHSFENHLTLIEQLKDKEDNSQEVKEIHCPTCNQKINQAHLESLKSSYLQKKEEFINSPEFKDKEELKNQINRLEQEIQLQKNQERAFEKEEFELETLNKQNIQITQKRLNLVKKKDEIFPKEEQNSYLEALRENNFKDNVYKKIEELEEDKNKIQHEIEESKKHIELQKQLEENIQKNINELQQIHYTLDLKKVKIEDLNKGLKEQKAANEENLSKLDELKSEVEYNEKIVTKIKEQEEKEKVIENKKNELLKKVSEFQTKTHYLERELKELENKREKKNTLLKQIQTISNRKEFLQKDVVEMCKILEETLFVEIHTDLSKILLSYFKELIEEQDIDVMVREDFSIIVEQNGYEVEVDQLSGGEKSALALSYRLALKEVIEKHFRDDTILDYIILDEPTDGFSQNQIQKFAAILQNSDFKQIFLVSHDSNLLSSGEFVYTIEKENHVSSIELNS